MSEQELLDGYVKEYTQPNIGRQVDRKLMDMLISRLMSEIVGPKVLELGYGDGLWTEKLIEKFGTSYMVDGSEVHLERAKETHGEKIVTYNSLFEEFETDERFNTILATYVLEHVIDTVEVLSKVSRFLADDGEIKIVVPNSGSLHRRLAVKMGLMKRIDELGESDHLVGHRRVYSAESLRKDVMNAGLAVKREDAVFVKLLPNSMMADFSDQMLEGLFNLANELPLEMRGALVFTCSK